MISFRYHIVTITAVFLALALGFLLGAAIRPTEQAVLANIDNLRSEVSDKRAEIVDLRTQVQRSNDIARNLSRRVVRGALVGRQVVYVDAGKDTPWQSGVRRAMSDATAQDVGTLTLTEKWNDPKAAAELDEVAAAERIASGADTGRAVMAALGGRLGRPEGARLVAALARAGFVKTGAKTQGMWPPQGTSVMVFAAGVERTAGVEVLAAFARSVARAVPTLVVAGAPDNLGAVGVLREEGGLPPRLATFDSAASDQAGSGPVLALMAAIDGRGANFGTASGVPYLPPV